MKICITGYYGMKNYGDDLFLELSLWSLKNICSVEDLYPVDGSNITIPYFQKKFSDHGLVGKILRVVSFVIAATKSDMIVYAGGSNFRGKKRDIKRALTKLFFSKKKLVAVGVSIGPFTNNESEELIYGYIEKFNYIGVRDEASFKRIEMLNNVTKNHNFDLAGIAAVAYPQNDSVNNSTQNIIGFSPCNFDGNGKYSHVFCDCFVDELKVYIENSKQQVAVKILCLNTHSANGDMVLCKWTKNRLDELGIKSTIVDYSSIGIKESWSMIGSFKCYVSGRLHGAVSAYFQCVPFHLQEYQEKCTEFLASVPSEIYSKDLKGLFDMSLTGSYNASESLLNSIQLHSKRALKNFLDIKDIDFPSNKSNSEPYSK